MSHGKEPLIINKQFREDLEQFTGINRYKPRGWTKNVYDPENKVYCGRTWKRWWQLLGAYAILFTFLAVWISIMFAIFYKKVPLDVPRFLAHQPRLSITPCDIEAEVQYYCHHIRDSLDYKQYIKSNLEMLRKYGSIESTELERFGGCSRENRYGYDNDEPCFFLKINKIIGWRPEVYASAGELPYYAPNELRNHISSLDAEKRLNRIWFSCETKVNGITMTWYPPDRSVNSSLLISPKKYEKNATDYQHASKLKRQTEYEGDRRFYTVKDFGRVVAVKFSNLPTDKTVKISCFMWAKNVLITKDETHGPGKVVIRLHLDGN